MIIQLQQGSLLYLNLIENLYLAETLRNPNPLLWIIRGLGTAVLHGCATAIVGIVSKDLTDRHRSTSWKSSRKAPLPARVSRRAT